MIRLFSSAGVLFATLDAPAARNALSAAMVDGLADAVARAAAPAIRVLVIRGAGGVFSAGGDFAAFRALMATPRPADGPDPVAVHNRAFGRALEALAALPVPTLAVVDGPAMGGGCGLAAACDVVVATPRAVFAMPEVTLGLPPAQIAPFVRARLGDRVAMRLMLTGERLDAVAAHAAGLVDILAAADDSLPAEALALVNRLLAAEPGALAATKAILATARRAALADALDAAAGHFAACLRSGSAEAGLAAFAGKRPAPWAARLEAWPA